MANQSLPRTLQTARATQTASESCDPHSPGPEEGLGPSGAEAGELGSMEAESASPGSSESESSETESEDSSPSESESEDSDPFDMEARRRGPLTSSSSDSNPTVAFSNSEESDSSSADSGFAKPSSSDTEADFTPSAPSLEETEEFGRKVTGLSGRARWQAPRCADSHAKEPTPQRQNRGSQEIGLAPGTRN
jgi:hypothetical protein